MIRIGAPLAKVPTAADTPDAVAMSMLLEDATALAELGDAGVPGAALRDCDLQRLLRPGAAARARGHDRRAERSDEFCPCHCCSSHGRAASAAAPALYEPIPENPSSEDEPR